MSRRSIFNNHGQTLATATSEAGVTAIDGSGQKQFFAHISIDGRFFVKINDIWVEKTNEVFNGSWKVLNTTDNVTEWRITQSDGTTVVQSGQVIAF